MQVSFKEDHVLASNHVPQEDTALFSPMDQASVPSEIRSHLKSQGDEPHKSSSHRISMSMQQKRTKPFQTTKIDNSGVSPLQGQQLPGGNATFGPSTTFQGSNHSMGGTHISPIGVSTGIRSGSIEDKTNPGLPLQQHLQQQKAAMKSLLKPKGQSFMSQQYNKALFTLSYLVSLQLRKYMEMFASILRMKPEDLTDPDIMVQKQEQIQRSLDKFKKHFTKNLNQLNEKEVHKKVSPKFTVCFMDLASFLSISLQPIVESTLADDKIVEEKGHRELQQNTISQLERHQPSVIKEEDEQENDEFEDSGNKQQIRAQIKAFQQKGQSTVDCQIKVLDVKEQALQSMSKQSFQKSRPNLENPRGGHESPKVDPKAHGFNIRKISVNSTKSNQNFSQRSEYRQQDELQQSSRDRHRRRIHDTPGLSNERDNPFNHSIKSVGISEISQAFNMHFNQGERLDSQSHFSHRSPSIVNNDFGMNQGAPIYEMGNYEDSDMNAIPPILGSTSGVSKHSKEGIVPTSKTLSDEIKGKVLSAPGTAGNPADTGVLLPAHRREDQKRRVVGQGNRVQRNQRGVKGKVISQPPASKNKDLQVDYYFGQGTGHLSESMTQGIFGVNRTVAAEKANRLKDGRSFNRHHASPKQVNNGRIRSEQKYEKTPESIREPLHGGISIEETSKMPLIKQKAGIANYNSAVIRQPEGSLDNSEPLRSSNLKFKPRGELENVLNTSKQLNQKHAKLEKKVEAAKKELRKSLDGGSLVKSATYDNNSVEHVNIMSQGDQADEKPAASSVPKQPAPSAQAQYGLPQPTKRTFERINTRYKYQNPNGIKGYLQQELEYRQKQDSEIQKRRGDGRNWAKEAVSVTSHLMNQKARTTQGPQKTVSERRAEKEFQTLPRFTDGNRNRSIEKYRSANPKPSLKPARSTNQPGKKNDLPNLIPVLEKKDASTKVSGKKDFVKEVDTPKAEDLHPKAQHQTLNLKSPNPYHKAIAHNSLPHSNHQSAYIPQIGSPKVEPGYSASEIKNGIGIIQKSLPGLVEPDEQQRHSPNFTQPPEDHPPIVQNLHEKSSLLATDQFPMPPNGYIPGSDLNGGPSTETYPPEEQIILIGGEPVFEEGGPMERALNYTVTDDLHHPSTQHMSQTIPAGFQLDGGSSLDRQREVGQPQPSSLIQETRIEARNSIDQFSQQKDQHFQRLKLRKRVPLPISQAHQAQNPIYTQGSRGYLAGGSVDKYLSSAGTGGASYRRQHPLGPKRSPQQRNSIKLKPFSKKYLEVALEHDTRLRTQKARLVQQQAKQQQQQNGSTQRKQPSPDTIQNIHNKSVSQESSILHTQRTLNKSGTVTGGTNRGQKSTLFNSKDIQKEIEQLRIENQQVKEILDQQHIMRQKAKLNQEIEEEKFRHEVKMLKYDQGMRKIQEGEKEEKEEDGGLLL